MGQKINPIGFRLGINRGWDSTWFAKKKDFGKYLIEDFKIRKYIKKSITNSGVSEIIIERSSKKCTVSIHTSRPGFVIGKKGSDVDKIKKNFRFLYWLARYLLKKHLYHLCLTQEDFYRDQNSYSQPRQKQLQAAVKPNNWL